MAHHPSRIPYLVYATSQGEIIEFPGMEMAGRAANHFFQPSLEDIIPLPAGSELFVLPEREPIGYVPESGQFALLTHDPFKPAEKVQAVAAFMSPAYTAIYTAAFEKRRPDLPPLPLFAYTAVGWMDDTFWVCGFRSDLDRRQEFGGFSDQQIRTRTHRKMSRNKSNRLIEHLGKCCLTYGCPAAKNFFLSRFEAPLPSSPACNANCLGCISLQPSGCCPSTQDRITFVPSPEEIAAAAISHLKDVSRKGVVSFGQGCEGEPLLQAKTLAKSIRLIRKQAASGTINLNTNGSLPAGVEQMADAGLDSIRISLNSAREEMYTRYYRPNNFSFSDVMASISVMKQKHRFVSLNYFILPGFTDDPEELEAFSMLVDQRQPDFIQLRNLNMDPDWYFEALTPLAQQAPMGIRTWLETVKKRFPKLHFGYFNPPVKG